MEELLSVLVVFVFFLVKAETRRQTSIKQIKRSSAFPGGISKWETSQRVI